MARCYAGVKKFLISTFNTRKKHPEMIPVAELAGMLVCGNSDLMSNDDVLNAKIESWMNALQNSQHKKHLEALTVLFEAVQEVGK